MGSQALGIPDDNLDFRDPNICRSFLCGCCPHDLFTNTKMDIGPCSKQHVEKLKKEYEKSDQDYSREWFSVLRDFQHECDRKIQTSQSRLDKTPEDKRLTELLTEIADLSNEIDSLNNVVCELGEDGRVGEAVNAMRKSEELVLLKGNKEAEVAGLSQGGNSQQQKLRVCEICSAFLSIYDSDRRLADHFGGKMHMGFMQIRDTVKELEEKFGGRNQDDVVPDMKQSGGEKQQYSNNSSNYQQGYGGDHRRFDQGGGGQFQGYHQQQQYGANRNYGGGFHHRNDGRGTAGDYNNNRGEKRHRDSYDDTKRDYSIGKRR